MVATRQWQQPLDCSGNGDKGDSRIAAATAKHGHSERKEVSMGLAATRGTHWVAWDDQRMTGVVVLGWPKAKKNSNEDRAPLRHRDQKKGGNQNRTARSTR